MTSDKVRAKPEMVKPEGWSSVFRTLRRHLGSSNPPSVTKIAQEDPDPFRVLVSTMISLRTKDEVTTAASERLLNRADTPQALAALPQSTIAALIYPAGFYRTKAEHLKATASSLVRDHTGKVPQNMDDLLALPGVGRKTANLVRNLGFGVPAICVDTHVHRISNRMGWVRTNSPEQTETSLMAVLPRRYWIPVNELLVGFGKRTCTALSPRCSVCPFGRSCARRGVDRHR